VNAWKAVITGVWGVLLLGACGDGVEPIIPTTIEVSRTSVEVESGDTARVVATVLDQNGSPITLLPPGLAITWTTSDGVVASVEEGVIRGHTPGGATIHARAGALPPAAVEARVTPATPVWIQLYSETNLILVGDTLQLHAYLLDARGNSVEGQEVTWTTLDPELAEVSSSGLLRGLSPGWAVIRLAAANLETAGGFHIRPRACTGTPLGTITLEQTITGELGGAGACDSPFEGPWPIGAFAAAWRLDLPATATVQIDLNSDDFDAVLYLSDLQLTLIARDDAGSEESDARIVRELSAGSYLVWASSFFANGSGAYDLTVR
jgi:hypothetical protein